MCVKLVKPSDDSRSEEEEFFYTPITNSNMTSLNVKRETVLRNIDNNKMEPVTLEADDLPGSSNDQQAEGGPILQGGAD